VYHISKKGAREVQRNTITTPAEPALAGNPLALGFGGMALTVALFGAWNEGRLHTGALIFVGMALFYGGLAQFIAGMWSFRDRNSFYATIFTSFGAFWLGLGALLVIDKVAHLATPMFGGDGITWFWFCWAVLSTYMWLSSLRVTGAVALTLVLWAAMFWSLWIGALSGNALGVGWTALGGWLGWGTAVAAGYTSFAEMVNTTMGKVVLPEFPTSRMPAAQH
jgi:uncharacterized protein